MTGGATPPAATPHGRRSFAAALALAVPVMGAAVAADQISKWAILDRFAAMPPPRVIEVTGFFNLVLTVNTGVSFGLFGGNATWKPLALSALAAVIVIALLVWLKRQPEPRLAVAIGLVSGGAIGNTIDRLRYGGVVDFLDFYVGVWHWYAFNLADTAVFLGVVLLLFDGLSPSRGGSKT